MSTHPTDPAPDDPPPRFRTWRVWYALVLGELALLIVVFYFFTRHFA